MASCNLSLCMFILMSMLAAVIMAKPADSDLSSTDCPENEIPLNCETERCFKTCDHLINFPPCPGSVGPCTQSGCVCKDDYLRDDQGVCVKTTECPEWQRALERNRKDGWTTTPKSDELN